MWSCRLCEKETVIISNLCPKCRKVKHLLNLYGDDVYKVLEQCLIRNQKQQSFKVNKINKKGLEIETDNSNDRDYKKQKIEVLDDTSYKQVNDEMLDELKNKLSKL